MRGAYEILIGIDPGTTTGFAVYDRIREKIVELESGSLIGIYHGFFLKYTDLGTVKVRIEDARKRKWYGNRSHAKMQGAGSIKRDSKIWEEICQYHGVDYEMIHPIKGATKLDAKTFRNITRWEGRTNEHQRDSAMIVYGL